MVEEGKTFIEAEDHIPQDCSEDSHTFLRRLNNQMHILGMDSKGISRPNINRSQRLGDDDQSYRPSSSIWTLTFRKPLVQFLNPSVFHTMTAHEPVADQIEP